MGTPENTADIVDSLRAAFAPGADAATKQRAASVLRSLLAVLESGVAPSAAMPAPASSPPDLLGALVEKFRPMLPADAAPTVPRLNIPLVALPKP